MLTAFFCTETYITNNIISARQGNSWNLRFLKASVRVIWFLSMHFSLGPIIKTLEYFEHRFADYLNFPCKADSISNAGEIL